MGVEQKLVDTRHAQSRGKQRTSKSCPEEVARLAVGINRAELGWKQKMRLAVGPCGGGAVVQFGARKHDQDMAWA
jgi:hypothetical protein